MRTQNIHNAGKTLYIQGSMSFSRPFTSIEQQTTNHANDVDTQHKHMYSFYIDSLCNVTFLMARFTGVRGNLN